MILYLRYYENEEISITIYSIDIPSIKYELKCNFEKFQKNRFLIFNNIEFV